MLSCPLHPEEAYDYTAGHDNRMSVNPLQSCLKLQVTRLQRQHVYECNRQYGLVYYTGRGESLLHDGRLQELLGYDVLPVMRLLHAQMAASCAHLAKLLRADRGHQKVSIDQQQCMGV